MKPKCKTRREGPTLIGHQMIPAPRADSEAEEWAKVPNKLLVLTHLMWYFNSTRECPYITTATRRITLNTILIDFGLVEKVIEEEDADLGYEEWNITAKGRVFAHHLLNQPLPEQSTTWSMPGQKV